MDGFDVGCRSLRNEHRCLEHLSGEIDDRRERKDVFDRLGRRGDGGRRLDLYVTASLMVDELLK